jgi:hypothetical protein
MDTAEHAALLALLQDGAMTSNAAGNASALRKVERARVVVELTVAETACVAALVRDIGPNDEPHPATGKLARKIAAMTEPEGPPEPFDVAFLVRQVASFPGRLPGTTDAIGRAEGCLRRALTTDEEAAFAAAWAAKCGA